nr:putative reverse transcriptase domain-containing protein [Tanacetum cinerariifolium]
MLGIATVGNGGGRVIDDSFEDINYVEASSLDFEPVSLEEVKDKILRVKLLNVNLLIAKIKSLNDNPTLDRVLKSPSPFPIPIEDSDSFFEKSDTSLSYSDNSLPEFETFSDHTEETSSGSTTTHADNSFPEYDSFLFEIKHDQGELTSVVRKDNLGEPRVHVPNMLPTHPTLYLDSNFTPSDDPLGFDLIVSFPYETRNRIFDPRIFREVQSKRFLSPNEFSILFIRDPLSPVFDTFLLFSSENKDQVFNPGILSSNLLSHRGKITSNFFKNPLMISRGDIPSFDVPRSPEYEPDPIEPEDHVLAHIPEHPEDLVLAEDEAPIEAYIPEVASAPTPSLPPSFLSSCIRPPHTRAAMAQMRAAVPSTYHSLLPSGTPPLLPIPLPITIGRGYCLLLPDLSVRLGRLLLLLRDSQDPLWLVKDRVAVRAKIEVLRRERLAYEQESIQTREALVKYEDHSRALEARVAVYNAVITCAEKLVRIPFGNEILTIRGEGSNQRNESRLNIISCSKAQEYMSKGCHVFLDNITSTKDEDKSKGKRLEDVSVVREFPEVFPKNLPGIPPTRQVKFQIDLVPSAAPVARAPYRLAPSEMMELADQLQELTDKGFIRPSSSPKGAPVFFSRRRTSGYALIIGN